MPVRAIDRDHPGVLEETQTARATITQAEAPVAVVCNAYARRDDLMVWAWGGTFEAVEGRLAEGEAMVEFAREAGPIIITSIQDAANGEPQTGAFTGRGFPPADLR
jgi:hypothetical protein